MTKIKIFTQDASSSSEKEFSSIRMFEGDKGLSALSQFLKAFQANQRQGNACAKGRGEVRGTGKKPYRQKGTGNARHGSMRSPIWRTGGVVHGPKPRDYSQKVNKRVRLLALQRALADKVVAGDIALIERFSVEKPNTKSFGGLLDKVHAKGSLLIVDLAFEDAVALSGRNLERVFMIDAQSLNPWDLVRHDKVLVTEQGFQKILERVHA